MKCAKNNVMTAFIKKTLRGEITIPIAMFTAVALSSVSFFAFIVFGTTNKISSDVRENDKIDFTQGERISTLETKVERLPYLEAKVDRLLEREGIDPSKVLPASVISATK